jgi:uncharacterized cupredoxin-like copper-binding protein
MNTPLDATEQNPDVIQAQIISNGATNINQPVDYSKIKFPPLSFTDVGGSRVLALRQKLAQKIQAFQL